MIGLKSLFKIYLIWIFQFSIFKVFAQENVSLHSETCINFSKLKTKWAIQMADASAKFPSGIFVGNQIDFGNFDECIQINTPELNMQGKYCLVSVTITNLSSIAENKSITKITQKLGICRPSSCSTPQLEHIFSQELKEKYDLDHFSVRVNEKLCSQEKLQKWSTVDIVVFGFLGVYGFWILICTLTDTYANFSGSKMYLFQVFSLYTNSKNLFRLTTNSKKKRGNITCLDGLRVLSLTWIILSHRLCLSALLEMNINNLSLVQLMTSLSGLYIYGGTYAVDSFFVLSGTLLSLGFFKLMEKGTNAYFWIYFYVHRIIRISVALIVALVFILTIFGSLSSGPWWNFLVQTQVAPCKTQWWAVLLQVQNYIYPLNMCFMPTWYLNVDFQLYFLAPLFLYPISKWKKQAVFLVIAYVILSQAIVMFSVYYDDVSEAGLNPLSPKVREWNQYYYQSTHTRATPWFVGLCIGFLFYKKRDQRLVFHKVFVSFMWILTIVALVGVILGIYPFIQIDYQYKLVEDLFYTSFSRTIWSLGLAWIIISCHYGYGGPINTLLSRPIWQPFVKISYGMYLFSFLILVMRLGYQRTNTYFSQFQFICDSIPDLFLTSIVGIVVFLVVEQPIFQLENKFWESLKRKGETNRQGVENRGFES